MNKIYWIIKKTTEKIKTIKIDVKIKTPFADFSLVPSLIYRLN